MSVPSYKRDENDFTILNKVNELANEAIRISKNEKMLPKKTEKILRDTFLSYAMNIFKFLNAANGFRNDVEEEKAIRRKLQMDAKLNISYLSSQIQLNINYLGTHPSKYQNLIKILIDVKRLLVKWMKSDEKTS